MKGLRLDATSGRRQLFLPPASYGEQQVTNKYLRRANNITPKLEFIIQEAVTRMERKLRFKTRMTVVERTTVATKGTRGATMKNNNER